MTDELVIYGHPASQPSRTVFWTCLLNDLPFKLGDAMSAGSEQRNPRGQVPSINDHGFKLAEMAAIVCYLADKHQWTDLYPTNLQTRATIHQYLHMHHSLVRMATIRLMAPMVVGPLGIRTGGNLNLMREVFDAALDANDPLKAGQEAAGLIVDFLEVHYFSDHSPFVSGATAVSLADLACYEELGQLKFANLFDFARFPKTQRWLTEMATLPHHDTIHAYNLALGDIASKPNNDQRFSTAIDAGFSALRDSGLVGNPAT